MNSSSTLHLLVLFLFIMLGFPVSLSSPFLYENCHDEKFRCGKISAGYPFFGGERDHHCGRRGLELFCEYSNNTATIKILGVEYQVLDIHLDNQILKIEREDFINNWFCSPPNPILNSILDSELFAPGPGYTNATLFYDCQSSSSSGLRLFPCDVRSTYANVAITIEDNIRPKGCLANLTIPVLQTSWERVRNYSLHLKEAWKKEFEVRWKEDTEACRKCNVSRGACGFDLKDQPTCYCPFPVEHWEEVKECPLLGPPPSSPSGGTQNQVAGGKNNNVKLRLGIGIPGAAIVVVLIGMGILCIQQQRRKKIAAQVNSRDLPTPPSKGPTSSTTNTSQSNPSYYISNYDVERGSTYFGAHVFTYEELQQATDNFNPSKELGEGGFGTVYHGILNDGRVVAVKRLYESNFKRVDQYMNEIEILTRIRHPNLVTLYGCTSRHSRELLLVYEYIPNGTVADHLHGKRSNSGLLTWHVRLNIAVETAKALAYLHAEDIIHRDVKSNNILLDKNFHVKVADFGLSRLFPNDVTHISTVPQGTPGYVDPEYRQCYQLTEKSDVYSFGVVLIELISAKQAVDINRHRHDINLANMAVSRIQNQALHELVDPTLGFENDYSVNKAITVVAELAFRCLQHERDMRPSMEEVLESLTEIQDEELGLQRAEVVDIRSDDVGLLRHIPPPLSPDSATEKWLQIKSDDVGLLKNIPPLSKDSATDKWLKIRST